MRRTVVADSAAVTGKTAVRRRTWIARGTWVVRRTVGTAGLLLLVSLPLLGQAIPSGAPELEGFARLIGGQWHLGEDSFNTFEWGVGGRSVKAKGFFVVGGEARPVSELTFAYHPGHGVVKGYGVAIEMGLDFFEYDVHFAGDTVTLDLKVFGPAAPTGPLRETWIFTDDDRYEWALLAADGQGGWTETMGGTFSRGREP